MKHSLPFLLVTVLFGSLTTVSSSACPPVLPTVTVLTLPVNQFLAGNCWCWSTIQGDLQATFEATPQSGGWKVLTTFKPMGLYATGTWNGPIKGKATSTTTLATGTSTPIVVSKLNLASAGQLLVTCTLTVDSQGIVSVQAYGLVWVKAPGSGFPPDPA